MTHMTEEAVLSEIVSMTKQPASYMEKSEHDKNSTAEVPMVRNYADPVEYFLGTGKEGYCMHYASAATLILQELGVPARYASGFVVKQGLFAREDGKTITKQDFFEKDEELKQRHEEHKKAVESQTESEQPSEATESSQQETTQQNTQETQ